MTPLRDWRNTALVVLTLLFILLAVATVACTFAAIWSHGDATARLGGTALVLALLTFLAGAFSITVSEDLEKDPPEPPHDTPWSER